mgnify:CR=1 FL=1
MSGQQMEYQKGLDGVIAAESRICKINGKEGKLYYLGYPVDVLVENSDFEEVTYLLLNGELPTAAQLEDFRRRMREGRHLKQPILDMIGNFPRDSHPMELLQSVVSYLSGYVDHKIHHGPHCNCRDTLHQVSQIASVIAAFHRIREGLDYVPPRDDLSHGANFLYMLHGEEPEQREGEIMDKCLVLHAEHSFNASTFTARVVASTQSTCYSSISAAMGALYGSLHGGANEKVIAMVDRIGEVDRAEQFVKDKLDRKEKVMGMGHRVYRAKDPRSIIMEAYLEELSERKGDRRYLDILSGTFMVRILQPWHVNIGKRLVKRPKIYFRDTGLLHALLAIRSERDLTSHPKLGASWEGFALEVAARAIGKRNEELYFWATHTGAEVDLFWQEHGKNWAIEVKYTNAPRLTPSMTYARKGLNLAHLWVLYPGDRHYPLATDISALPLVKVGRTWDYP